MNTMRKAFSISVKSCNRFHFPPNILHQWTVGHACSLDGCSLHEAVCWFSCTGVGEAGSWADRLQRVNASNMYGVKSSLSSVSASIFSRNLVKISHRSARGCCAFILLASTWSQNLLTLIRLPSCWLQMSSSAVSGNEIRQCVCMFKVYPVLPVHSFTLNPHKAPKYDLSFKPLFSVVLDSTAQLGNMIV